ncbi:hypothetical protein [Haloarcula salinisoli]|uniref:Uncharacterized protein n=1 Tax=Haloarcula salinisoli TaxID=2487746 RepID=A0A8J7YEB8_9EURY|nr:hypothetical protein [Halomicroarcula salinisoli]MBX0286582.1 hypothetical protein [Halomicroarcula salinisoli]MBX0303932.1 hypothetical protein [Halomicroarcula salinisoli]
MAGDFEARDERNLVEYMAALFGFARLSTALPGRDIYPPYLFVGFFSFLDLAVLQVYVHLSGGTHILLDVPSVAAGYVAVLLGVYGIQYMSSGYESALAAIRAQERADSSEIDQFQRIFSWRAKVIVYAIAALALYANTLLNVGVPYQVTAINFLFTWEFVFLPVIVEFALTYYGIHFLLPRRFENAGFNLFFYDPRNMGGFAAVGQLLKRSYYLYTAGLVLFFFLVYGPVLLAVDGYVPGLFELLFFSAAWFVGLLSIGYSMHTMHQFMSAEKEQRIRELEEELHGAIENPYDINNSRVADQEQLDDARRRLEQVRSTRVYPATFTMWSQIAISVLLPQLLQITVQTAL